MDYLASCAEAATPIDDDLPLPTKNGKSTRGPSFARTEDGKSTRGPGFTRTEDLLMCKAFIAVSEDSQFGTNQRGNEFETKMHDYYTKLLTEQERINEVRYQHAMISNTFPKGNYYNDANDTETPVLYDRRKPDSLRSRFKNVIAPRVSKFLWVKKGVKWESGWDKETHYQAAKHTFLERYTKNKLGNPDEFRACAEYLEDKPKWHSYVTANNLESDQDTHKRPVGQKKAKVMLKEKNIVKEAIKELKGPFLESISAFPSTDSPSEVTSNFNENSGSRNYFFSSIGDAMQAYAINLKEQQEFRMLQSLPTPERDEIKKSKAELMREELELKKAEVAAKKRKLLEDYKISKNDEDDDDDSF